MKRREEPMSLSKAIAHAAVLPLVMTIPAMAAPVEVRIVDLPSDEGSVFIMLCTKEAYENKGKGCMRAKVAPSGLAAHHVFEDVAPGDYIIQAVHDQNANGKVDTKWYGAPKEAYGMSTNPEPRRGRPKFEDGVFTLGEEPLSLEIVMRGGKR